MSARKLGAVHGTDDDNSLSGSEEDLRFIDRTTTQMYEELVENNAVQMPVFFFFVLNVKV